MRHNGKSLCAAARKHAAPGTCRSQPSCPTSAPANGKQVFLRTRRMCHGCLHVNILTLHLFCSERKEKRRRSSCEDVAVGHASNMPEAETFL